MSYRIIKPKRGDVLVGPLIKPTVTPGGIHYTMQYQDDAKQYLVIAVGEGCAPELVPGVCCLLDPGILGIRYVEDRTGRLIVRGDRILAIWEVEHSPLQVYEPVQQTPAP